MKPKSFAPLLLLSASACITSLQAAPLDVIQQWNFNTDSDFEGWAEFAYPGGEAVRIAPLTVAGGVMSGKVNFGDPQLNVSGLSLNSTTAGYVKMRYRVLNGSSAPIIPASPAADLLVPTPGGSQGTATTAPNSNTLVDPVNGWTEAVWDITDLNATTITALRLDPVNGLIDSGNGTFEIDYIEVLETDVQPQVAYQIDPPAIDPKYTLVKEWDSEAELGLWTGTNFSISSVTGGTLTGTSSGTDAQVEINTANFGAPVPAPASGVFVVEFKLSNNNTDPGYQQLYAVDGTGGTVNGVLATLTDTSSHVVRATLKDLFTGELRNLRLDPTRTDMVETSIEYIRVYVDSTQVGWDTNTVTTGAQGGTGTWNTSNPFFFDAFSSTNVSWPSPLANANRNAVFGATAGTVTVGAGGVPANNLSFLTTGYTVTGAAITLSGATSAISGTTGVATTINAPVNRTSTADTDLLNVAGPGTFSFGGGGTIARKLHFKTNSALTAGSFTSSGTANSSNGLCVYNGATLTLNGATLNRTNEDADDAFYVGNPANTGDFAGSSRAGTLVVNSGSTLAVSGGRGLAIGFGGSNNSVMTVNGGNVTAGQLFVGWNSTGTLNVTGGTVTVNTGDASTSAVRHSDGGGGTINLTGGELKTGSVWLGIGASNATVPLDVNLDTGGTLETDRIRISTGTGTGTYTLTCNFDGGTLRLPAVAPTGSTGNILGDISLSSGTAIFNTIIEDGGLILNTNGRDTAINTVLAHDATLAATPDGGLTKNGLGKLTLNGVNTYTGNTTVTAGTLEVSNDDVFADTSTVTIPSSGALVLTHAGTDQVASLTIGGVPQGTGTYAFGTGSLEVTVAPSGGYSTWATANADSQPADMDFDLDGTSNGVEYFMGETGSTFTSNPSVVTAGSVRTITWPKDPAFAGSFKVQISDTLAIGSWTDITPPDASIDTSNPNQVVYTLPSGSPKKFARLNVTATP